MRTLILFVAAASAINAGMIPGLGGPVEATFIGASASYDSHVRLGALEFFPNHATPPGTRVDLGIWGLGVLLPLELVVDTQPWIWNIDPVLNVDGLEHARITSCPQTVAGSECVSCTWWKVCMTFRWAGRCATKCHLPMKSNASSAVVLIKRSIIKNPRGGGDKMKLRERYPFDPCVFVDLDVRVFNVLAATQDRQTWWVEGGRSGGVHMLVHYAEDGRVYMAPRLHASTVVAGEYASVNELLRRAADQLDVTEIITPTSNWKSEVGGEKWKKWHLPLPGFASNDTGETYQHIDRWFTRTERALPLPCPSWAPGAHVWDIREGVYMSFPDSTCRLIPRREYYEFSCIFHAPPIARQGDLLVFDYRIDVYLSRGPQPYVRGMSGSQYPCIVGDDTPTPGETEDFDRHKFLSASLAGGYGSVTHPEHGILTLPEAWQTLVLAPGTSRPFQRGGKVD